MWRLEQILATVQAGKGAAVRKWDATPRAAVTSGDMGVDVEVQVQMWGLCICSG